MTGHEGSKKRATAQFTELTISESFRRAVERRLLQLLPMVVKGGTSIRHLRGKGREGNVFWRSKLSWLW
jgi:hypothetical protein